MADEVKPINFNDAITPSNMFDYSYSKPRDPGFWEGKFPSVTVAGNKYDFLQDEIETDVTMARFHPFNSPTDLDQRRGSKVSTATLGYLKRERALEEEAMLLLAQPGNDAAINQAIRMAYNDADAMIRSIEARVEQLRAEVVTTGKLVIDENGYKDEYDFHIPDENKKTFNWNAGGAKILDDIFNLCDEIENNGQDTRPAYMVCSTKTINLLLNDELIREAMFGVNSAILPNAATLNAQLQAWGLPQIVKYNNHAFFSNANNTGSEKKRLLPEDEVLFIPEGPLGNTVWGLTPEEANSFRTGEQLTKRNNIVLQVLGGHDPENMITKASARVFVTLAVPKRIAIGTITA